MDLKIGDIFEKKYQIISLLGTGGYGQVYRALDTSLNREVAIKFYQPLIADDSSGSQIKRFQKEALALTKISHKNIVSIYRFALLDNLQPYIILEYIDSPSLEQQLKQEKTFTWQTACKIILSVCEGLKTIHSAGIVHRDIKPQNIMFVQNASSLDIKIIDFGLCKFENKNSDGKETVTSTGLIVGTVQYLSPEQCASRQADERSDIYSMGIMFFELLTGKLPFEGQPFDILSKHINEQVPSLSELTAGVNFPLELEKIINKCTEKNPAKRYQSVQELIFELKELLQNHKEDSRFTDNSGPKFLPRKKPAVFGILRNVVVLTSVIIVTVLLSCAVLLITDSGKIFFIKILPQMIPDHNISLLSDMEFVLINSISHENLKKAVLELTKSPAYQYLSLQDRYLFNRNLYEKFKVNTKAQPELVAYFAFKATEACLENIEYYQAKDSGYDTAEYRNKIQFLASMARYLVDRKDIPERIWQYFSDSVSLKHRLTHFEIPGLTTPLNMIQIEALKNKTKNPILASQEAEKLVITCIDFIRSVTYLFAEQNKYTTNFFREINISPMEVERYAKLGLRQAVKTQKCLSLQMEVHIFLGLYYAIVQNNKILANNELKIAQAFSAKLGYLTNFEEGNLLALKQHCSK